LAADSGQSLCDKGVSFQCRKGVKFRVAWQFAVERRRRWPQRGIDYGKLVPQYRVSDDSSLWLNVFPVIIINRTYRLLK
jgi:hypothetical protein